MGPRILVGVISLVLVVVIVGAVLLLHRSDTAAAKPKPTPNPATAVASANAAGKAGGLQISDETVGTGAEATVGSTITVKYTGTLADGTVFDSTDKQGGQPATFTLAKGQLIDGWVDGIPGMKVGGKRKLVIPPALGYGSQANSSIPANSTLTFEIELVAVK